MVKKIVFILFLALVSTTQSVKAEVKTQVDIEVLSDGDWIETVFREVSIGRSTQTKSGSKTVSYYNANHKLLWSVEIQATFTFGNKTATAVRVSAFTTAPSPDWKISSRSATKVKNVATVKATAKRYLTGIAVQTVSREVSITCTANGILI